VSQKWCKLNKTKLFKERSFENIRYQVKSLVFVCSFQDDHLRNAGEEKVSLMLISAIVHSGFSKKSLRY